MGAPKLNARDVERIERLWMYGRDGVPLSTLDLAIEFDVSRNAIDYHVAKFRAKGLRRQVRLPHGRPRTFDYDKAHALMMKGLPYRIVAIRLGVSLARIYQIAKQAA